MAACTEELAGRCCPGSDRLHLGGSTGCTTVLGPDGCELCGGAPLAPLDWRHALRAASSASKSRTCRSHRPVGPPVPAGRVPATPR